VPAAGGCILESADAGLFVMPPPDDELESLTLDVSDMVVLVAADHRLARAQTAHVADVVGESFLDGPQLDGWRSSFWSLDDYRGGRPRSVIVAGAEEAVDAVAAGRAVATAPSWSVTAMPHPGIVAVPLRDGPAVATYLVWHRDDERSPVRSLVQLGRAWSALARSGELGR
jgi:DNA-binding transcriptional LysR family regulator